MPLIGSHERRDHPGVALGEDPGQEYVMLASFPTRRSGEHSLMGLRREFRRTVRKGHATAFVVSANRDGSLTVTQSRALTASGFVAVLLRLSVSWMIGFMGILSGIKGAKGGVHAAHARASHVGSEEQKAHRILAEAGPHAAVVLLRCSDREIWPHVTERVPKRAASSWHGSHAELLGALDPGSQHDWVRSALGEQPSAAAVAAPPARPAPAPPGPTNQS
jgi:hypothetical protein